MNTKEKNRRCRRSKGLNNIIHILKNNDPIACGLKTIECLLYLLYFVTLNKNFKVYFDSF